jgi:predicted AAA+ superfamily ATPase
MDKENIALLIRTSMDELETRFPKQLISRSIKIEEIPKKICALVGMRRSGKTTLLYQKIVGLIRQKKPLTRILFLNFEDDRFSGLGEKEFGELVDTFYQLFPENHTAECYLFFDEIQYVAHWPRVLRRLLDTKNVHVTITGSSAKMLSTQIATALRGRSLATEVFPFDFNEYLSSHSVKRPQVIGKPSRDVLLRHLRSYLLTGGFPEIQFVSSESRIRILQDYVQVVTFRDIVERYQVSNLVLIKRLIHALLCNVGRRYTVNKWFNDFRSEGIVVGKNTLYEYLEYISDAYLGFSVPLFSPSVKKQQVNPKKFYAVDTGLVTAFSLTPERELGHYFENLIYLDLRRRGATLYYYLTKTGKEVDFLAVDARGNKELIQVCWDISDRKTRERETAALAEAEAELGIKGRIVTPETYVLSDSTSPTPRNPAGWV